MSFRRLLVPTLLVVVLPYSLSAPVHAGVPLAPAWEASSVAAPTNFKPGDKKGDYFYEVTITNVGGTETDGSDIVLVDTLPAGLTVKSVDLRLPLASGDGNFPSACKTETSGGVSTVTCTISEAIVGAEEPATVGPSEHLTALIHVTTPVSVSGPLVNQVEVSGGGSPAASAESVNQASEAPAEAGFSLWRARFLDGEGNPVTAAGSHPFQATTHFAVNTNPAPAGSLADFLPAHGDVKNIEVALPPGFVGNPTAATYCTPQQFTTVHSVTIGGSNYFINDCPNSSAIGVASIRQIEGRVGSVGLGGGPIYNLEPPRGMPAQFGFHIAGAPIYINTKLRTGADYGVSAYLLNTSEAKRISSAMVSIWGVPAEENHDPLRGECAELGGSCDAEADPRPFLRMPTSCRTEMRSVMSFDTWLTPGAMLTAEDSEAAPVGCAALDFSPDLQAQPTHPVADSPTGLHMNIHLPQVREEEDPEGLAEADLEGTTFVLPRGLTVNPSSAAGLSSCSPEQIGYLGSEGGNHRFTPAPPQCPDQSKIASVTVRTPLVAHPLPGSVYLAQQDQNPFGSLLAIYVTVSDPESGIVVKIPARVTPDLSTGQMTATAQAPQAPFEDFELDFFSGPRAPLRTPPACGAYTTNGEFVPWSFPEHAPVQDADSFAVSSGPAGPCPTGTLEPKLAAGLLDPKAGAYSPFTLRVSRADGTAEFDSISATPPPGLLANLRGIPYCTASAIVQAASRSGAGQGALEASSPSCPGASRVGTASAGAGAGPSPFYVAGPVYLAGPYKGAPLSLLAVVPALAGPFDLGAVVTRVALEINPETAQVSAKSDPLPRILHGIPLDLRDVRIALDRQNFTLAPTNCEPMALTVQVSNVGGSVTTGDRFQVGGCNALRFKPTLRLRLKGGVNRDDNPALRAELRPKAGNANIARASVALPQSIFLDQSHIGTICTRVQFAAGACPQRSIYGKARAITPLLAEPLEGPVYLRSSTHQLPDLVADLKGQIDIDLVGRIDSKNGGIRTTFMAAPDAPVSKFVLQMAGGKKSLLVNSVNLCRHRQRATARITAHNGRRFNTRPVISAKCKGGGAKKKRNR